MRNKKVCRFEGKIPLWKGEKSSGKISKPLKILKLQACFPAK